MADPISLALLGASALGGIFGNKKKTQEQFSQGNTYTETGSQPDYDPKNLIFRDRLINETLGDLESNSDLSGYTASGLSQINTASNQRQQALKNALASRGQSYSPVSVTAPFAVESARYGDSANFLNSIPLLQRQLRQQSLQTALDYQSRLPVGQRGTQAQSQMQKGTGSQSGNPIAGGLGGFADTLGFLYGMGAFSNKNKPGQAGSGLDV